VVEVVEADAPSVLVIDVECLNLNVDAKREDVLSAKGGHFVSPIPPLCLDYEVFPYRRRFMVFEFLRFWRSF
jgi:hypothetical protein